MVLIVTSLLWERNCSRLLGQCSLAGKGGRQDGASTWWRNDNAELDSAVSITTESDSALSSTARRFLHMRTSSRNQNHLPMSLNHGKYGGQKSRENIPLIIAVQNYFHRRTTSWELQISRESLCRCIYNAFEKYFVENKNSVRMKYQFQMWIVIKLLSRLFTHA